MNQKISPEPWFEGWRASEEEKRGESESLQKVQEFLFFFFFFFFFRLLLQFLVNPSPRGPQPFLETSLNTESNGCVWACCLLVFLFPRSAKPELWISNGFFQLRHARWLGLDLRWQGTGAQRHKKCFKFTHGKGLCGGFCWTWTAGTFVFLFLFLFLSFFLFSVQIIEDPFSWLESNLLGELSKGTHCGCTGCEFRWSTSLGGPCSKVSFLFLYSFSFSFPLSFFLNLSQRLQGIHQFVIHLWSCDWGH